jgi:general secretion pathway protein G
MTITQKQCAKGFTLMELMIVIMIIGLLGAVVGPAAMKYLERARKGTAKTTMRSFKDAINMYQMNLGHLPPALKDLIKRPTDERDKKKWEGPYIEKDEVPEDPWNNSFVYKITPGAKHPYDLYSRGPNGAEAPKEEWISVWDE